MNLIAAGPARHVPEILYRRWHREGSLTATWKPNCEAALVDGQQQGAARCLSIIRDLSLSQPELELVSFCLFVSMMTRTRKQELRLKSNRLVKQEVISEVFRDIQLPKNLAGFDAEIVEWVFNDYGRLLLLEGNHALQQGDGETALVNIATAISLNPRLGDAHATLEKILEACGLAQSATAVARRLHLLRLSNKASRLMRHRVTTRPGQENDEASGGESRGNETQAPRSA